MATPRAPKSLQEAGLAADLVTQLVLKILHLSGELTGTELARRIGLPFYAFESVLGHIKQQHHCEVSGGALGASSFLYRITDAGRARAMLFMEHNHYVGQAPVPLAQYRQVHVHASRNPSASTFTATPCGRRSHIWS